MHPRPAASGGRTAPGRRNAGDLWGDVGGAGGTIGTLRALQAAPDGYTLIQTGVGQNGVAHGLDPKLGYHSNRDFIHISQMHTGPKVLDLRGQCS